VNTGRTSVVCWVLFVAAIVGVNAALHAGSSAVIACAAIAVLSFIYAMYLGLMAMRKGDPVIRKYGRDATAEIVSAKATSWSMAAGEYYGIGAPRIWKYRLNVTRDGHQPYRTTLYICAHLGSSGTIPVRVSRLNRWRVTVDAEKFAARGANGGAQRHWIAGEDWTDRSERAEQVLTVTQSRVIPAPAAGPPDVADELTKLAGLRDRGVLTPNEFESEKAKLLRSS
jgi:hypothetical protein